MAQERKTQPALPTGNVTLLFTDISGSSRLWNQHGDRFIPVWQAHDALMRDAIARFGGYEVKSEGDAFMVAFADPCAAVQCAVHMQIALNRYPWPPDIGPLRVRIGLHTGEPFVHGNDYFGPVVNRAAHICNAAHGGQVLLSEETYRSISHRIDPIIQFVELGDFRLKDMGPPQRLREAQHPDLEPRAFPPPRSLEEQPNNLPIQRTSFVGRAQEIEQIASFLAQGEKPALTLTGPGGIGKTRLSLQAAASRAEWFPDGVWYVNLMEARDIVGAAVEIATAMNIPLQPNQPPLPQVRAWLADRRCLLILDDANTIPQADRLIRELVSGATNLRCLATSRASLQIAEADQLQVQGLPTAPPTTNRRADGSPANAPARSDAEQLFLDRAAAANPRLKLNRHETAAMQTLIEELDGVPISIERAAQLMNRVPPSVVLEWLSDRLEPDRVPPRSIGVEKFKSILRRSAQKVLYSLEDTARTSVSGLNQLLLSLANIATDRHDEQKAEALGRESLKLSLETGDDLGVADAMRQLARARWQKGDTQCAAALLGAAVQIYRRHNAPELSEAQQELDWMRERLEQNRDALPLTPSLETAVKMAFDDQIVCP